MTEEHGPIPDEEAAEAPRPVHAMPDESAGFRLAERACWHALALKADDVVIMDLRAVSDVCDFFVVASGLADVQVRAIAKAMRDGLAETGEDPAGVEGESDGRWVLLDYVDVVIHVLKPDVREYYQLERLWGDAPVLPVGEDHLRSDGFAARHPGLVGHHPDPAAEPPNATE